MPGMLHHVIEARDERGNIRTSNNPLVSMSFFDPRSRIPEQPSVRRDVWRYSEYTGDIVGKEVAERWYSTGIFVLYAEDDLFDKLLTADVWEKGVVPADVIRNVRFVRGVHLIRGKHFEHQPFKSIRDVSKVSNRDARLTIDCQYSRKYGKYSEDIVFMLHHIGPTIYQLRKAGHRNICVVDSEAPEEEQDLTYIFDVDRATFADLFDLDQYSGVRRNDWYNWVDRTFRDVDKTSEEAIEEKQREAHWVEGEFKDLQDQIAVLRMRGAYLQEQSKRLETVLARHYEQIAQSQCRTLCDAVLFTMPREIRNIIYAFLLDEHNDLEKKRPGMYTDRGLHQMVPKLGVLQHQHFVQAEYVGEQFHGEVLARFYEVATLRVIDPGWVSDGQKNIFLFKDPLGGEALFGQCMGVPT
ncbi:hypothetical protein EK21DRAFT_115622 [Setomelanomma holmii]|uniref:Uncharacterized protein n=1 Tax=Setomelanomma holmii TaxID=210430 RepID=A0A9P4LJJ4_9PLEO|nr:hypothetical protein EK21DRAFT_115622 [Setomelanomma holmii]